MLIAGFCCKSWYSHLPLFYGKEKVESGRYRNLVIKSQNSSFRNPQYQRSRKISPNINISERSRKMKGGKPKYRSLVAKKMNFYILRSTRSTFWKFFAEAQWLEKDKKGKKWKGRKSSYKKLKARFSLSAACSLTLDQQLGECPPKINDAENRNICTR